MNCDDYTRNDPQGRCGIVELIMAIARRRLLGTVILVLMTASLLELVPAPEIRPGPLNTTNTSFGTSAVAVDQTPGIDQSPTATLAKDGSVWLAWMSNGFNNFSAGYDIIYKTLAGGVWSSDVNITNGGMNTSPAITQLQNGTMILFWSANRAGTTCAPTCTLYYARFLTNAAIWTRPVQLSSGSFNDSSASVSVGRDGTLWLAWTRTVTNCSVNPCFVSKQILYRTLSGNVWSNEIPLTSPTDPNWNWDPSITVSNDGMVRLVWSKGIPSQVSFQLYYKTYNGIVWSSDAPLFATATGFSETLPSIMQDRNGTLWIFWTRTIALSATLSQDVLMSLFSYNNGATWLNPTQITNDSTTIPIQDNTPAAVQGGDKYIWVFYATNLPNDWDIYARKSISPVSPVHLLDIYSLTANSTIDYPGWLRYVPLSPVVVVKITVLNLGDYANEAFTLQATAVNKTTYIIGSANTQIAAQGGSVLLTFNWDTTGGKPAFYTYNVTLTPAAPETVGNKPLNSLILKNAIRIIPFGDLDKDGLISINDAGVFFYNFDFAYPSPRFNPYADPDNDGIIGIIDVGMIEVIFDIQY